LCVALSEYWLRLQAPCSPHALSPCSSVFPRGVLRALLPAMLCLVDPHQVSPATWSQPLITLCGLRLRCLAAPSPCASAEASRGARFHRFPTIQREWFRLQVRPRWCGRRAFGTWRARQQTHTVTHLAHNSQLSCVWLPSARDSSRNTRRAIVLGASGPTIYVLGEMILPRARGAARKCTRARESAVGRMLAHARARPFACALARARAHAGAVFLLSVAYRPPRQLPFQVSRYCFVLPPIPHSPAHRTITPTR